MLPLSMGIPLVGEFEVRLLEAVLERRTVDSLVHGTVIPHFTVWNDNSD